ncbi:hypothetical protein Leryth_021754 [Lithospermum erythrorhizon]|nr:hypothetical protein Leryth_021754 [Lithospermum erythrorhizon]
MAEGLVPITREYLAAYYDKYPFPPLSSDVSGLVDELRSLAADMHKDLPLTSGETTIAQEANCEPPHKIDENLWKNREQIEEIIFLLEPSHWPEGLQQPSTPEDAEFASLLGSYKEKFQNTLKTLVFLQNRNSEYVFNTVMTYMPQDFRGSLIKRQRERSERNKQALIDALVKSGGTIREQYALLWKQQMERRRQLAQLGSATGIYKALVKYLVGVPQVLLDFIPQINDDKGPMEEQRQRYGPPLYSLTTMVLNIRLSLTLLWEHYEIKKLDKKQFSILEEAMEIYNSEFERFIKFMGDVFLNSPFFITAVDAGAQLRKSDELKEFSVPPGESFEVGLIVESINSFIAWDFSVVQGRLSMDIGFSVEFIDPSGRKTQILPYMRYESDQGNFNTLQAGNYKLIWDNSHATFFRKVLRYKVDCIPPVVEPESIAVDG